MLRVPGFSLSITQQGVHISKPPESFLAELTTKSTESSARLAGISGLSPGDLVAKRYLIEGLVGSGGMGEVYRAVDCRLRRVVAIKLLSSSASKDTERCPRLEREAQAIAGLSHPHICALHHFDTDAGRDYLVLEYIEGHTLASRLNGGRLPACEWQRIAAEIGGALAYAHRHGVIHRDLKPGNIMLTNQMAKLVDFGLATNIRTLPPLAGLHGHLSSTLHTQENLFGGTLSYMSPEQAKGEPVDTRTDIFSFGCVLYEMITGQKAFSGQSALGTLSAVLLCEPASIRTAVPQAPHALSAIVRKCLRKNPEDRFNTMEEVCDALRRVCVANI